jgi:hypothetical protein
VRILTDGNIDCASETSDGIEEGSVSAALMVFR